MRPDGPVIDKGIAIIGIGPAPTGAVAEALRNLNEREKMKVFVDPLESLSGVSSMLGIGPIAITVPRPNKYTPHQGKKEMERLAKRMKKEVTE